MADDERADKPDTELNPDGTPKPDLRYSKQERGNVRVDRKLDGSGHLARGDRTHMSVLNFSAQAKPREERDPEFEFRPRPNRAEPESAQPTPPESAAPEIADPAPGSEATPAAPGKGSVLGKIKQILGF